MLERFEDQPWYREWRETLERVIAAQMKRDSTKHGTPEREAADREYDAAPGRHTADRRQGLYITLPFVSPTRLTDIAHGQANRLPSIRASAAQ
jgi:hypothetical protein